MAPDKEPWGKAAQATRHRIRVGKRAAGIIKGTAQCRKKSVAMKSLDFKIWSGPWGTVALTRAVKWSVQGPIGLHQLNYFSFGQ
ncbi:hypothetical protein YC2023_018665 [Brassica napus]